MAHIPGTDDHQGNSWSAENGIKADTIGEYTSGSGVTVSDALTVTGSTTFDGDLIGVAKVYSTAVAYDDTSLTAFTSSAGEEWIINRVWFVTNTDWDGTTATVTVGETAGDVDGYLALANAQLLTTYDESGGVTGFETGSYGLKDDKGGVFQWTAADDCRTLFRLVGAETIDIAVTVGDATQGAGTCYVSATRIA